MNIKDLNENELVSINGGLDKDYNDGVAVGRWFRAAIKAFGDVVDAVSPFS